MSTKTKLVINKEVGVYWASIKPVQVGSEIVSKVNVRIMHDDMFRYATFACLAVTEELLQVTENHVVMKDSPETDDEPAYIDYSNWDNSPEAAYEFVCSKLGYELIKEN